MTVDRKRGWQLTGRIGGLYVFDDEHHGSDSLLKLAIKGAAQPAASATPPTPAVPAKT